VRGRRKRANSGATNTVVTSLTSRQNMLALMPPAPFRHSLVQQALLGTGLPTQWAHCKQPTLNGALCPSRGAESQERPRFHHAPSYTMPV